MLSGMRMIMTDLERQAEQVLREIGLKPGQSVLDFGCGSGTYALPAARIVGGQEAPGVVYAIDRAWHGIWPGEGLAKLAGRAEDDGLRNVRVMKTSGDLRIDLPNDAVDVALAHDVLHSYYFAAAQIPVVLREIHRVLKPAGILSLYPGDPDASGDLSQVREILEAVRNAGFRLLAEYAGAVVHENRIVPGCVRVFRSVTRTTR
ncbi:MAG: class I SAM-dependent methyltransferase [Armatimonadota bacterium]